MPIRMIKARTANIVDNAVTTAKINDLAVTTPKINADAVTGAKIADDTINLEHIAPSTVQEIALATEMADVIVEVRANERHRVTDVEIR